MPHEDQESDTGGSRQLLPVFSLLTSISSPSKNGIGTRCPRRSLIAGEWSDAGRGSCENWLFRGQARARAASSVLPSSIAIVIGPTPPGTGVIAPATSRAASKSTSPHELAVGVAVDADVDHRGARLDPVAAHQRGPSRRRRPATSALDASPRRRSRGARVAHASPSRCASSSEQRQRAADEDRAADDHRRGALELDAGVRRAARMQPVRRARHEPRAALRQRGRALVGVRPSTSLAGSIAADHLVLVDLPGSGSWTRMPSTSASASSSARAPSSSASASPRREPVVDRAHADLLAARCACCGRRSAEAGSSPTSTVARPGRLPAPARRTPRRRAATRSRTSRRRPCRR